jgi:uncharacterized RDD family membrane protein YckC
MSNGQNDGRFAPPQAHVEDVSDGPIGSTETASRASRFWAVMIDGIVSMILLWVVSKITPWDPYHPQNPSLMAFKPLTTLGSFALYALAQGYLLATRGQSIGKILLKIRIVRTDGSQASWQRLLGLRYGVQAALQALPAAGMIFGLVDSLWIFGKERRCLHDLIADTIVIKA